MTYDSIYRGIVKEVSSLRGECRILVPEVTGVAPVDCLPWARQITFVPTDIDRGSLIIPKVNDIVWVMYEGGRKDSPVYLGGSRHVGKDLESEYALLYKNNLSELRVSEDELEFVVGSSKIKITGNGVYIYTESQCTVSIENGFVTVLGDLRVTGHMYDS